MGIFEELLITFMYSKRAQFAFVMGPIFFILILLIGHHMANSLHFEGVYAPISNALRPYVEFRYEHIAWANLIGFWVLAGKMLIKDRRKYLF
jgi:hypothetical protein